MIAVRGRWSGISDCLIHYCIKDSDEVIEIKRGTRPPYNADRYFICQGYLCGKPRIDQTDDEVGQAYFVNYIQIASICDDILENNETARICVIGSESGISGSYDGAYADSKRLLHHYVETKRIKSSQQIVCVAPSIIEDAAMTTRRFDRDNLNQLRQRHPKGRFLTCMEVAQMVYFLLYVDLGYTTGVVVRMNGGRHCV